MTPGAWHERYGFPFLSGMVSQFLIKDLVLFAASVCIAGEAMRASRLPLSKPMTASPSPA